MGDRDRHAQLANHQEVEARRVGVEPEARPVQMQEMSTRQEVKQ